MENNTVRCVLVATSVIKAYLGEGLTPEGLYDIYEISKGNKTVLLNHMKALKNIFEIAIDSLEGGDKNGKED